MLIASGLTLLGLALGFTLTYWALVGFRIADLDEDNRLLTQVIAEATLVVPRYEVPPEVESYLVRNSGVSAAQVYVRGQLLWADDVLDAPNPLDPQGLLEGHGTRTVNSWRVHTSMRGDVTVQAGRRLTALQATLHPYVYVAPALLVGLSLLSGVLAWFTAGVALRPLERLARATRDFDVEGELPSVTGNDEAALLAQNFSALLTRLKAERRREQRFLAYAAHELRTPISALRASLESARLQQSTPGRERRASVVPLERLHRDALRLETFAQNLLALSRAEASDLRAEAIDLADLLGATYDRFQPLALELGYELVLEAESAPACADPRLIEQALNNLIANALRHSPKGAITLWSGVEKGQACLEVADLGPGLPESPKEGLGLRVVRAVVEAHDGALEFGYDGGLRARLCFAALPDATEKKLSTP